VVEIGVGFGGLAAMNALVSGAVITLVDLPEVANTAMRLLQDCGLGRHARIQQEPLHLQSSLAISNYAFTELNADLQAGYLEKYLKHARHGMIISNAAVFARTIGGRSDQELVEWLRKSGIPASMEQEHELLSPIDSVCGARLIHW
jgi:hypothetical protein